ncbi:MAG TPA: CPBP family glutamic-type intramembrane protease [Acidimicrobiia bacterium]
MTAPTEPGVSVPSAPPGWYADPWGVAHWRWWDGYAWTGYTNIPPTIGIAPDPRDPTRQLQAGGIAALGFLVGFVLSNVIAVFMLLAGASMSDPLLLLGATLGIWTGLGGACVVAVRRKGTGSLRDLGLTRPTASDVGLGIACGVGILILVVIVAAVLHAIAPNVSPGARNDLEDPLSTGAFGVLIVLLIGSVGAPFFEELFFRGLVQGTLIARWGTAAGIAVQAFLFGMVHLQLGVGWGNLIELVVIGTVGICLGLLRRYTGKLVPGMFAHGTYNFLILVIGLAAIVR